MAKFRVGEATIEIGLPDGPELEALRARFAEYDANYRRLCAIREDALRDHPGEIVIVTDRGTKVRYYPSDEALHAAVPAAERGTAALELLVERPEILIV